MSMHTNWDRWMTENIRYALTHNVSGTKMGITFQEYAYWSKIKGKETFLRYIDVVGKQDVYIPLNSSVIVEIKSGVSDFFSGHGRNFVGKHNFFATDQRFIQQLQYIINEEAEIYTGIGILLVYPDGKVSTIRPSENIYGSFYIDSNFDQFSTDDEVEEFFQNVEIPRQLSDDASAPFSQMRETAMLSEKFAYKATI